MKRSYICQVRTLSGKYLQQEFSGIVAVKEFLRKSNVRFSDCEFSHLGDNVVILRSQEGLIFEIELLPDSCNEVLADGKRFIPSAMYKEKYKKDRGVIQYAIRKGRLDTILVDGKRFIEDKEIVKNG